MTLYDTLSIDLLPELTRPSSQKKVAVSVAKSCSYAYTDTDVMTLEVPAYRIACPCGAAMGGSIHEETGDSASPLAVLASNTTCVSTPKKLPCNSSATRAESITTAADSPPGLEGEGDGGAASSNSPAAATDVGGLVATLSDTDLADRQGLRRMARAGLIPSIGTALHTRGECSPCHFWFRGECKRGRGCLYCHVVHPGQKEKRLRPSKRFRDAQKLADSVRSETATGLERFQ